MKGSTTRIGLDLLLPLAIASAAFWVHREVLGIAIFGQDGQAAILASRIQSFSDFIGTFTEVMMDGRLPVGDFYRPLGNLFLAFDYAVWGVDDFGYQLTSMLLWCGIVIVIFFATRKLLGEGARLGPALAAIFFALHPVMLSVVPYPARRTEILGLLFIGLTLLATPLHDGPRARRRTLLAGLLAMFAVASKETAAVAIPLMFLLRILRGDNDDLRERITAAVIVCVPAAALTASALVVRTFVIGGVGGYYFSASEPYLTRLIRFGPDYLAAIFGSGAYEHAFDGIAAVLGVVAMLVCIASLLSRFGGEGSEIALQRARSTSLFAGVWLGGTLLLASTSFQFSPRYMLPMIFASGMLIGALAEAAVSVFRSGGWPGRGVAFASSVALVALARIALDGSMLSTPYPEFQHASRVQRQLLAAVEQRIDESTSFDYIDVDMMRRVPIAARAVDDVWMIGPWGLQAWIELVRPDRAYNVTERRRSTVAAEDFWSVALNPVSGEGS